MPIFIQIARAIHAFLPNYPCNPARLRRFSRLRRERRRSRHFSNFIRIAFAMRAF